MAENDSFVFYLEWIDYLEMLPPDKAMEILKAIVGLIRDEKTVQFTDPGQNMAYSFIANQVKRDKRKYKEVVSKRAEAGRKGGLAKQANARSAKQSLANKADPIINTSLEKNTPRYKTENHHVTGTSYRQKEIESLGEENPIYEYSKRELIDEEYEGEKVYYYDFNPSTVELIEEPDNKFDPNAVKVVIDSVHVGYIKKGSCTHVKNLLKSGRIAKIDAEIHGGKYKILYSEYDEDKDKEVYEVETGESNYYVTVEIKYLL